MYTCDRCGKGTLVGMKVSHSHRRTKKRSLPNLHKTTLVFGGQRRTLWLCTKCLRLTKKESSQQVIKPEVHKEVPQESKKPAATLSEDIEKAVSRKEKESTEIS